MNTLFLLSLLGCWSEPAVAAPTDAMTCDTALPPEEEERAEPVEPLEPPQAPVPDPEHPTDPTM